jgi:integrase
MQGKPIPRKRKPTGIEERHSRSCGSRDGGRCNCKPSYRAWVYDRRSGAKVRKVFPTLAAAKAWRADATSAIGRGKRVASTRVTLREAAEAWVAGATADPPTVLNRSGQPYKPSALREYVRNLNNYVLPELGGLRLADVGRGDLQALVDRLLGRGLSASKVRNVVIPIRVVFRHAIERDEVQANPASGLRLPNGHRPRDRAASATEAADLLAALPIDDRALWATAFYAGLRRGELRALRVEDVDLAAGIIRVKHGWDDQEGEILPKSAKGSRTVPIVALLRDHLAEAKARTGRTGADLIFGRPAGGPFTPTALNARAATAWAQANEERAERGLDPLQPIGLHECRHTFVSLLHDAGLSLERIGDYVGHSSAYMTDRYRHLLEGHEAEAARLLDEYLARADTAARVAQLSEED